MKRRYPPHTQFVLAFVAASLVSLLLFAYGAYRNHSLAHDYLIWNLFLAWLPLVFAGWLTRSLRHKRWSDWGPLIASLLWLLFLPNSFYMVSDFIHLQDVPRVDTLFDTAMFGSFIFVAMGLGLSSLYLVHRQLRRRFTGLRSTVWVAVILWLCGFAIYLGRDLRWNSWDLFTNPAGLIFDITDRLIHPAGYGQVLTASFSFFALVASLYAIVWQGIRLIRATTDE